MSDASKTPSAVRKKIGESSIEHQTNIQIANLENSFIEECGTEVRVAGSDNSYLCDKGITLVQVLRVDMKKIANTSKKLEQKNSNKKINGSPKNENTVKIRALVELFSVAGQPDNDDLLPENILEAKKIWQESAYKSSDRVVELIKHHVSCSFIADNIANWRGLLRDDNDGEFEADEINVTDVDFSNGPLPLLSLECQFTLPLAQSVSAEDIVSELEGDACGWGGCIIPRWEFQSSMGLEDLDLTIGEHNGVELVVVA